MGEGGSGPGWAKFTFTFYCFPRYLHDRDESCVIEQLFNAPVRPLQGSLLFMQGLS